MAITENLLLPGLIALSAVNAARRLVCSVIPLLTYLYFVCFSILVLISFFILAKSSAASFLYFSIKSLVVLTPFNKLTSLSNSSSESLIAFLFSSALSDNSLVSLTISSSLLEVLSYWLK